MKWMAKKKEGVLGTDRLAGRIAKFITRMQTVFAVFMSRITKDRSTRALKRFLFLFLLIGSLYSTCIIYSAFEKRKAKSVQFGHLNRPIYPDDMAPSVGVVTKSEYRRLQHFDHYMDSLKNSGSSSFDSILRLRPGLLDSVKQLMSFYNNQFQNQK